jgi:hypothetical protein
MQLGRLSKRGRASLNLVSGVGGSNGSLFVKVVGVCGFGCVQRCAWMSWCSVHAFFVLACAALSLASLTIML